MGWLFYTDPTRVQGHAGEKDEINRLTTHKTDEVAYRPLQISKVGSTWYAAVEKRPLDGKPIDQHHYVPNDDGSFVFAVIVLVRYDQGCFGYKDMDETMGPNEARAPMSLIRKLSPLIEPENDDDTRQWAHKWRKRCKAFAEIPSYQIGDVIELASPLPLQNGSELKTVKKASMFYRGKNCTYYIDQDNGGHYRLTKAQLAGSTLTASAISEGSSVLAEFAARRAQ